MSDEEAWQTHIFYYVDSFITMEADLAVYTQQHGHAKDLLGTEIDTTMKLR